MKYLLLAGVALLALSPVAANAAEGTMSPLSGFYVGGYGGYSWNEAELDGTDFELDVDGADYGGFVGYKLGWLMDEVNGFGIGMSGALEVSYGSSEADDDDELGALGSVEKGDDWGVSFRPGFEAVDNMTSPLGFTPYGILGWRWTEYEADTVAGDDEETYDGFELGLGTEITTFGNFGVRAEYSHTFYGEQDDIDIDSDAVRVGLAYHF
jgi:opacity protein-like surface antigen